MDKAWTSARHLPTPCPHSALSRPHPHRFNNWIRFNMHGRLRRHRVCQDRGGRAAPCSMRSAPPRPIPHCTVTKARLRSQPAGRWPAPCATRGETTPQTRERKAPPRPVRAGRNRGQITQESRSSVPGITVKCAGIRTLSGPSCRERPIGHSRSRPIPPFFRPAYGLPPARSAFSQGTSKSRRRQPDWPDQWCRSRAAPAARAGTIPDPSSRPARHRQSDRESGRRPPANGPPTGRAWCPSD